MSNINVSPSEESIAVAVKTNERGGVHTPVYDFNTDGPNFDAFARLRVSNPITLFDSKQIHNNSPLFWDEATTGSGSATWTQATASTAMEVTDTSADSVIRQTFRRFNYQPGKSQLMFLTGTLNVSGGGTGITRGWGYGDADNGYFIQEQDGAIQIVERSSVTGSAVDNEVNQADWNLDTMDGNGDSGITLDFGMSQIFFVDMEWLGVGRVRCGFVIDGIPIYVHEFLHANRQAKVYMSTPNLPVRYYIVNDGTGQASALEHICATVISEGGQHENGPLRYESTGAVASLGNTSTYALIGIRLKSANVDADIIIKKISSILSSTNDQAEWKLILNPTIAGTFTYADATNSVIQVAKATDNSNTVTNGTVMDGGYFSTAFATSQEIQNAIRLGIDLADVRDQIVLCIAPITSNITARMGLTWRENS